MVIDAQVKYTNDKGRLREVSHSRTLFDPGATTIFINERFVQSHHIHAHKVEHPVRLVLADGRRGAVLDKMASLQFRIGAHEESITAYVVQGIDYDIVLGMPWFRQHNPQIDWGTKSLTFHSDHCRKDCLDHGFTYTVYCKSHAQSTTELKDWHKDEISPEYFMRLASRRGHRVFFAMPEHYVPDQTDGKTVNLCATALEHSDSTTSAHDSLTPESGLHDSLAPSLPLSLPHDSCVGVLNLHDSLASHDSSIAHQKSSMAQAPAGTSTEGAQAPETEHHAHLYAMTPQDFKKYMDKKELTQDEITRLLPSFIEKRNVACFSPEEAKTLPRHRPGIDHEIKLKDTDNAKLPYKKPYAMTQDELVAVKKYIDEMLEKGFIRPSTSAAASPVLIVKKPGGGLRFCVDYRAINALTIRNRYPIPLVQQTLDRLGRSKHFTKLDIIAAFNRIRMAQGNEWLTAFNTRYGLFEYTVMPFGVCNGPGSFQGFIDDVLRQNLDNFCTAYLDDVLIYSESLDEHKTHVNWVLDRLRDAGLYVDIRKCDFAVQETKYLGLIISTEGVKMDPAKVQAVLEWPVPKKLKDVQAFLGFANFYRKFIFKCSHICKPLTELTKKDAFVWTDECTKAFNRLKSAFTSAPILRHFDPTKQIWVECDASDFCVAGVLSQMFPGDEDNKLVLQPVAYFSRKLTPVECNYEIYDKELLAIIEAFEQWRPELAGMNTEEPIKVMSDHKNLEWFMSTKQLNRRQARWAEFLAEFNFVINYRPGKQGTKPDSLTRRSGDLPHSTEDPRVKYQNQVMLKPHNIDPDIKRTLRLATASLARNTDATKEDNAIGKVIDAAYQQCIEHKSDELLTAILSAKKEGAKLLHKKMKVALSDCEVRDRQHVYVRDRLYVPKLADIRTQVIERHHSSLIAGHGGKTSTFSHLRRYYWWPNMHQDVARFTRNCHACLRAKPSRAQKQGLLNPIPPPERPFAECTVDFIVDLPKCSRNNVDYTNIMVVVDRLSKMRKFIPLASIRAKDTADAFANYVWPSWGFPFRLISDRGTQFTSHFWHRLCKNVGMKPTMSTAHHPETDGQTENANQFLEQYLRLYVNYAQDNWVDYLRTAEFSANLKVNETTKMSPFMTVYGFEPRSFEDMYFNPETKLPNRDALFGSARHRAQILSADNLIDGHKEIWEHARQQITWMQELQANYANEGRQAHPDYKVGDLVSLDSRYLRTTRESKKLDHKRLGPFPIKRIVHKGRAYELDLSSVSDLSQSNVHPVFHPWLLHHFQEDPLSGQVQPPPPPVKVIDDDEQEVDEWELDKILDSRRKGRGFQYLVKWLGYDSPDWIARGMLTHCDDAIADYHHAHPTNLRPNGYRFPNTWKPITDIDTDEDEYPDLQ